MTWNGRYWHKRFIIDDVPKQSTHLLMQFHVSKTISVKHFYEIAPPIHSVVERLGIPLSHLMVNIITDKAVFLRPYNSLREEPISFHPDFVEIHGHRVHINKIRITVEDSRDYIQFNFR
jgi:hypothetical protein